MKRWLAGWLSITRRYSVLCQNGIEPILKPFRPSGSRSTLVFTPCAGTKFQGEPRNIPQNSSKIGVNRQFQAKRAKYENHHISQNINTMKEQF